MATKFLHKSSTVAGKIPASTDLVQREIALNTADSLLYALNSLGVVTNLNPVPFNIYNGTTVYRSNVTARFASTGTTDGNGRVSFNLTKDGTTTGAAIFSKIFSVNATGVATNTNNVGNYPFVVIESVTAKIVTVRALTGIAALLTFGATVQFVGAGVICHIDVSGAI